MDLAKSLVTIYNRQNHPLIMNTTQKMTPVTRKYSKIYSTLVNDQVWVYSGHGGLIMAESVSVLRALVGKVLTENLKSNGMITINGDITVKQIIHYSGVTIATSEYRTVITTATSKLRTVTNEVTKKNPRYDDMKVECCICHKRGKTTVHNSVKLGARTVCSNCKGAAIMADKYL